MTTTVTVTTTDKDGSTTGTLAVGDLAQKHVLRKFNPSLDKGDVVGHTVDLTKVLCAALIQQMINLRDAPDAPGHVKRAAATGITMVEQAQMQLVKANFVQA